VFLIGLGLALAGVALLVQSSVRFASAGLLGDGFGVVTALFYAAYLLAVKALRDRGGGTLLIMAVTSTITTIVLLPVALAMGERLWPASGAGWLALFGLALVSHAAGQGLIAYALAGLPAAFSSVSLLLQPVMATLFAWILLGEPVGTLQLVGGVIVLAGIYFARRGSL
jgi:drug/metabolite transporter (DMT)-like permease